MRCFLAIELGKEAKEELAKIQKQLPEAKMKLVENENLHLTLKFLGEISDSQANHVKEALRHIKFEKINAKLGNAGVFSPSFIRVVWVALEPSSKIKELHAKIDEILEKEKFRKDSQFESHVTLARVKTVKNRDNFVKDIEKIKARPVNFEIESFILKKSTLTGKGPVYEDIARFELL